MLRISNSELKPKLEALKNQLEGDLFTGRMMRALYATDASVYREMPLAVAMPKSVADLQKLMAFAAENGSSIIPRAAGTSLAGQCVGDGIVVDVSKYFNSILELNIEEQWVRVEPGVVRDELNAFLKPHGLFFGPNTSTANRATIGGMVGNNSSGSYSIVYHTTREHTLEVEGLLSDGSKVHFKPLNKSEFKAKCALAPENLEGQLYRQIESELSTEVQRQHIRDTFPKAGIHRRNTGYAVDEIMHCSLFESDSEADFNFCKLLAGSEGTLALSTAIKVNLDVLPPPEIALLAAHFVSIDEALRAVMTALDHQPRAVELMDKIIMDCTKGHPQYEQYRFFMQGDPEAMLLIEIGADSKTELDKKVAALIADFKSTKRGYHFPVIYPPQVKQVWELRKAGLGLLANLPGDAKAVAVIEDTAVHPSDLPEYIQEFTEVMNAYGQRSVYYAHAGAGELHLRPILNLKDAEHIRLFREIGRDTFKIVKKYGGSISGEHGDGRVRAEFIPMMVGEKTYDLFKRIKQQWDPQNLLNPGKIVDAPPMNSSLRYEPDQETPSFDTVFDFSENGGILRTAEKCNGSGDCRKLPLSGGTMCPSYMATRNEKDTTRARANILRELLTQSDKKNPFNHEEIYEVMDLCLACKGCKSECPSQVDMATLKAEFLHQYYKSNGVPLRAMAIANIGKLSQLASIMPKLSNLLMGNRFSGTLMKKILGVAPQRSLPEYAPNTLRNWFNKHRHNLHSNSETKGSVWLFCDEFSNFNDVAIGIKCILLLTKLGYQVDIPNHVESGRAYLSKGLLNEAQEMALENVKLLAPIVSDERPLIGIEPSAILGFRDEYPKLMGDNVNLKIQAEELAPNCLLIDEFLHREIEAGNIPKSKFTQTKKDIKLHGHCHQKAISSVGPTAWILSWPENFSVEVIPSGCCGMAGSFGYEKEHFELSMQVGELVLFPAVRAAKENEIIAAPGTSCRHQIKDGTGKKALHPIEVLYDALVT